MDLRVYSGQFGSPSDSCSGEEGVNYLRRLKGEVRNGVPADASAQSDGRSQTMTTTPALEERRQSPRLRCSGSVEFRTEGSDVRMWGTLTDISRHGCYVEMHATFPVGTIVNLVLTSCGIRIQAPGAVRTSFFPRHGHLLRGNRSKTTDSTESTRRLPGRAQRHFQRRTSSGLRHERHPRASRPASFSR